MRPDGLPAAAATSALELDAFLLGGDRPYTDLLVSDDGFDFEISTMETILSVQQLMHRLGELASDVNRYMNAGTPGATYEYGGYEAAANEDTEHLEFEVATDGRLKINGTGAFWSCFCIEVPSLQNQWVLGGQGRKSSS